LKEIEMVTDQDYWDEANNQIELLHKKLAEREAEIAVLREVLETVKANAPEPYCAITRAVDYQVQEALSTPQSSSYLEQWEKDRFVQVAHAVGVGDWTYTVSHTLHVGTPLYARKEK
jgi:hypothetical protein